MEISSTISRKLSSTASKRQKKQKKQQVNKVQILIDLDVIRGHVQKTFLLLGQKNNCHNILQVQWFIEVLCLVSYELHTTTVKRKVVEGYKILQHHEKSFSRKSLLNIQYNVQNLKIKKLKYWLTKVKERSSTHLYIYSK